MWWYLVVSDCIWWYPVGCSGMWWDVMGCGGIESGEVGSGGIWWELHHIPPRGRSQLVETPHEGVPSFLTELAITYPKVLAEVLEEVSWSGTSVQYLDRRHMLCRRRML